MSMCCRWMSLCNTSSDSTQSSDTRCIFTLVSPSPKASYNPLRSHDSSSQYMSWRGIPFSKGLGSQAPSTLGGVWLPVFPFLSPRHFRRLSRFSVEKIVNSQLRPCLDGSKPLALYHAHVCPSIYPLQKDPHSSHPSPHILKVLLGHLLYECCLLSSAPMLPQWEAHLSRILSLSPMKLLITSVVVASAMCFHGLHIRYKCV